MLLRSLALLVALSVSGAGCRWHAPPNLLVVVIDTLRADRLGCYGNPDGLTPFLDDLAKRGVLFAHAYAASSWTSPSVASLFTSRYPSQHKVTLPNSKLTEAETTFPEKLQALAYASGGFSANLFINESTGYAQGFDLFRYVPPAEQGAVKTRAPHLRHEALEWLDRSSGAAPRMLYLQYMEPHSPYEPPEPFRTRFVGEKDVTLEAKEANDKLTHFQLGKISPSEARLLELLYDAEVAAIDSDLALLFRDLEQRHFLDNAFVVITADHGEEFHDHGSFGHGSTLYNETIHVPLIMLGPGIVSGKVVNENVSLVDLAPTLLDSLGLAPDPVFEGRSLVPLSTEHWLRRLLSLPTSVSTVDVVSELLPKAVGRPDFRKHASALVRESLKVLVSPKGASQLYDLAADPEEQRPNPPSLAASSKELQLALQSIIARLVVSESSRESVPLDPATREKLRQLGYGSR